MFVHATTHTHAHNKHTQVSPHSDTISLLSPSPHNNSIFLGLSVPPPCKVSLNSIMFHLTVTVIALSVSRLKHLVPSLSPTRSVSLSLSPKSTVVLLSHPVISAALLSLPQYNRLVKVSCFNSLP